MTQITPDHAEWAVVGRLRRMLEESAHQEFSVTQSYAFFTAILCWVTQRIRIGNHNINSSNDHAAHNLLKNLEKMTIASDPWRIAVGAVRIAQIDGCSISIPEPENFQEHSAARFLINLRDAVAHGDARTITPFNSSIDASPKLIGFAFSCTEFRERRRSWQGSIVLLEADMRRIGIALANSYCNALRHSEPHRDDNQFGRDAGSIKEVAA